MIHVDLYNTYKIQRVKILFTVCIIAQSIMKGGREKHL